MIFGFEKLTAKLGRAFQAVQDGIAMPYDPSQDDELNYGAAIDDIARRTGKHPALVLGILAERSSAENMSVKEGLQFVVDQLKVLTDDEASAITRRHLVTYGEDGPTQAVA